MFQQPKTVASGSPFQHLASRLNLTTAKKAEDDDDKEKKAKAEDKDDDKDEKKSKKAKNEDDERGDEEEEMRAEEKEEPDDGEKDEKKSKKSKSKKAEDDEDKKDARAYDRRAGALLERERIGEILLSAEANVSNACYFAAVRLALKSNMTADEVLAILELNSVSAQAPPKDNSRRDAFAERMSQSPKPDIGGDGEGGSELTFAQKVVLAGKKRRGEI